MGKKYKYEEVKEIIEDLGYNLIDTKYNNIRTPITISDKIGYYYKVSLDSLNQGYPPSYIHCSNPYTIQNINLYLIVNNINLELLSNVYTNSCSRLVLKDKLGYLFSMSWTMLSDNRKHGSFPIAYPSNDFSIQNIKLWCELNSKPFELISDKYETSMKKLEWRCLKPKCGETFKATWNRIIEGMGCGACDSRQIGISNCLATKNPELAKEWHPSLNGDLTPFNVVKYDRRKVWWKCFECEHEWDSTIKSRSSGRGCPECNKSKGEKRIKEWLVNNSICYEPQKEFKGLLGLGSGLLSYDFYLPEHSLLIEYQGVQHEKYKKGLHKSKKDFEKQVEHDRRKKEYTLLNKYNFLEIWYCDFDKIENILESYLLNKNLILSKEGYK